MDELDDVLAAVGPRVHLRPIVHQRMTVVPLTRRPGGVQACKPNAGGREEPVPQVHEGYEWIYVLNGNLRLVLGDQHLVLPPAESS